MQVVVVVKADEFKDLESTMQSNKTVHDRGEREWSGWRSVSGVICEKRIAARVKESLQRNSETCYDV